MRIYFISAGAAGMYCGSCIRDNALAAELIRQGHDVLLIPLYTPTLTDEPNVSHGRVFFGGLNVYLQQYVPFFRRAPRWLDRLLDSPRMLRALSQVSISNNPQMLGDMTVSMLRGEDGSQNREFAKLLGWLRAQPAPEIVSLHNSMLIRLAAPIKKALGCAVCCTLQGEDLFLKNLQDVYRTEALELIRAHVDSVDAFAAVSESHARFMQDYLRIPRNKMRVLPLGINLAGFEPPQRLQIGPSLNPSLTIGFFARITPEKGLHVLCAAYRYLRQVLELPASRLEVAGYLAPEYRGYLRGLESQMKAWGLEKEFHYRGVLDREEKTRFLRGLDVLSVPAVYDEPKGIYLLEAMACGVPVVQPRRGAFPEIIEKTGGGILFNVDDKATTLRRARMSREAPPSEVEALAQGIYSLWRNRAMAEELGRKGAEGVRQHYSVAQEAARAVEIYRDVLKSGAAPRACSAEAPL